VYQGIEPLNPRTLALTRVTNSVNFIGVLVNDRRIAPDIVSYLSVAIDATLVQPLPRI
jgi:hypothetical protein